MREDLSALPSAILPAGHYDKHHARTRRVGAAEAAVFLVEAQT